MRSYTHGIAALIVAAAIPTHFALAADHDNNVEWNGVSHLAWMDRRPLCPINGESFNVLFRTYHYDITTARVHVDDGTSFAVDASFLERDEAYDVWIAAIPATAASTLSYYIELTDGNDTDYLGPGGFGPWSMSETQTVGSWTLSFTTLEHAPIGATPTSDGGAVFKVWAPAPTRCYVRGGFNNWGLTHEMDKIGDYFVRHIPAAGYRQPYKFFFQDTNTWKPDARARALNPSDNYNSLVEDPFNYAWGDANYTTPAFEDLIIYELHVGTFSGRNDPVASGAIPGTYRDVAAHVGHLRELGVTAVELMPITEYPWDFSGGYNPVTQWAPEWKHGDPDDFKYMVDVLHQNGIAVLVDIVWNHFSGSDNYLWMYTNDSPGSSAHQIYFDGNGYSGHVDTPWGAQADFDRAEVRDYFADSALYWIEELRVDGFRMDATGFMNMYQGSGWGLMQRMNDEMDVRAINKISIAEQLPDDGWVTRPTELGGAGFDAQWHDAFVDNLRSEIFDAGWNQADVEMWKIRDILNGSGQYLSGTQVVNYFESHDEAWPSSGGQRTVKTLDTTFPHDDKYAKGRTKLAQGLVMFAPGIPMFLQGAEWLEDTDFGSGDPGGADRIDWSKKSTYASILLYFKDMIRLRKTNGALRSNAGNDVYHINEFDNVIAFHRWDGAGNDLIIVANFNNTDFNGYRLGFPQHGTWYEILNSQASVYDGNGSGNGGAVVTDQDVPHGSMPHSAALTVPEMGLLVFRYNDPADQQGDVNCDHQVDFGDINPFVETLVSGATPCCYYCADMNYDGYIDFNDINPFVQVLVGD